MTEVLLAQSLRAVGDVDGARASAVHARDWFRRAGGGGLAEAEWLAATDCVVDFSN